MLNLYEVCGNRLLVCDRQGGGEIENDANNLAKACWDEGRRIADGVVWFQRNGQDIAFGFVNPDGSVESVCGNGFFAVARALETGKHSQITLSPAKHAPADMEINEATYTLSVPYSLYDQQLMDIPNGGKLYDTGSPHVVMIVSDVQKAPLHQLGIETVDRWKANLTMYSFSGSEVWARTFERGVNAETDACGTGALAVSIDSWLRGVNRCKILYPGGAYDAHVIKNQGGLTLQLKIRRESIRSMGNIALRSFSSQEVLDRGLLCSH